MGADGVSQAAALALRQLQDQLAAAYTDLAACQEESASLRTDARAMIEAQHAEVVSSKQRANKAQEELEASHGLLRELKTALEATLVDNAKCKAEVAQMAELKLALESCRVALEEAKRRERGADERAAAAEASRRQAEAAAAAAERRAADAECLRREGSSAAVHVQSQLQSLQQSLQEQRREVERLSNAKALLEFRCDAAEARAVALQAQAGEAERRCTQETASLTEKLKEEESRRRAVEDQTERMDGVLAALKQEATALRLAAEEHAKGVSDMRVTAEAAQRFLEQERGMRDALTSALQHTETTMQRVLSLNHALVESFAQPLILASLQHQQEQQRGGLAAAGNAVNQAARAASKQLAAEPAQPEQSPLQSSGRVMHASVSTEGAMEPPEPPENRAGSNARSGQHCSSAPRSVTGRPCTQTGCPKCLAEQPSTSSQWYDKPLPRHEADVQHQQAGSRHSPRIDEDTLEQQIQPAIERHLAEMQKPKQAQLKPAARVRRPATVSSRSAEAGRPTGGTWEVQFFGASSTGRGVSWGVPPARKPTLAPAATATAAAASLKPSASGARAARGRAAAKPSQLPASLLQTREQVAALVMGLEDELAVLDLRYADLLRQQQQLRGHNCSPDCQDLEEEVAHAAAQVREAMQRKGRQIQQLRQYTACLTR